MAFLGAWFLGACSDDEPIKPHVHEVASVVVQPATATLATGAYVDLVGAAHCGCGSQIYEPLNWSSSDETVATVNAAGRVTALSYGTAQITAERNGHSAMATVQVQAAGTVVQVTGGTVLSADGNIELEIPANALEKPTDIVIEKVGEAGFRTDPLFLAGTAYRVKPEALQLRERARLRIHFDPANVPDGVYHEQLRVREREQAQDRWRETEQNQLREHAVEALIQRFGVFGITIQPPAGTLIGAAGGTAISPDGIAELSIPAGALDAMVDVVLAKADDTGFLADPLYLAGTAYEVRPETLQLQERAQLRIRYDPAKVPQGILHEQLRLRERERDQDRWRDTQQNQLQLQEHMVQAQIERFGLFAIMIQPAAGTLIGPEGGTVLSADGLLELIVPPGALDAVEDITVVPLPDETFADEPLFVAGTAYDLGPDGLEFDGNATLRIEFDPGNVPEGVSPSRLRIQAHDPEQHQWRQMQHLRVREHVVESTVSHFTVFAVVALETTQVTVASVKVTPSTFSLVEDDVVQLVAEVRDADGELLLDRDVVWTSSKPNVATVDEDGLVTAVGEGTVTISASADGVSGKAGGSVSGKGANPGSVVVVPASASLYVSGTVQLAAEVFDNDGNVMDVTVSWSSSATAVATVNGSGLVTAVGPGTATITARYRKVSGSAAITVAAAPSIGSVVIEDPGHEPVEVGLTKQLTATAYDADGDPVSVKITWSSGDVEIATVDQTGLVTGVGPGTVNITATAGQASDAVEIRVVGETTTEGGNNMSWPVVFADGVGLTGLPPTEDPGVRPGPTEGIVVDAIPFFWNGNEPTYDVYYEQQTFNAWRAEWLDAGGQSAVEAEVYWGDNITHQTWAASRPIRIEVALSATAVGTLTGFNMTYLYGEGPDEMQGTDGSTAEFTPLIYTVGPELKIEKLSGPGGSVVATAMDVTMGSEVNVGGRIIYGEQFTPDKWTPPTGVTLDGWYRLTFTVTGNVAMTSVGNAEGTYLPTLSGTKVSVLEIYVKP